MGLEEVMEMALEHAPELILPLPLPLKFVHVLATMAPIEAVVSEDEVSILMNP